MMFMQNGEDNNKNNKNKDNKNNNENNDNNKNKENNEKREIMRGLALVSQLGLSMAFCVLAGFFIGRFLDDFFGTSPWLLIAFVFIGSGAAFKLIYDLGKDWK
jgi:ATP synthase protein I